MKQIGLTCVLMCWANVAAAQTLVTLVTLEGDRIEGEVTSIGADGRITIGGRAGPVDLQGVREIERQTERVSSGLSAERLYLADGSVLVARNVTMDEGAIGFDWLGGEGAKWGVDQARGILLAPLSARAGGHAEPEGMFVKAMGDAENKQDQLMVIGEEGLTVVPGALAEMDAKEVTFVWNGQSRKIDRRKVYGIVLAPPPPEAPEVLRTEDLTGLVCVELADGSRVWGKLAGLAEGKLRLMRGGRAMVLPWEKTAAVRVRSGRMVFMSDLKATEERTAATVTFGWPMRKDESVMGGPIEIGDRRFERGLGVHARSELNYDIGGKYRLFTAVIGLAPGSKNPAPGSGEGDCVFVVKGDGKRLLEQRMKAGEAGKEVRLDVSGIKRLELIVEEGENWDVGDRANWADARLIR
ncbi:MAG: NPCBM/NEW2 domain-containing protein [Phycisphaerales bacterium]